MTSAASGTDPATASRRRTIALLAVVAGLGPFTMQIFVPALPMVRADFGVSVAAAQLTFSAFIFALAPALLVYGPLSDRIGRRPVLLGALALFCVGSLIGWLAPTLEWLVAGRVIQALGAAAGLVVSRALLSDLYGPEGMVTALSYMTMAMVVPPMMAPIIGGVFADTVGWRWVFPVLLVAGLMSLAACARFLPAAAPSPRQGRLSVADRYRAVLTRRDFHRYALPGVMTFGMFYGFMAGAPYLMVSVLGRSATEYGLLFLMLASGYIVGNFVSGRTVRRFGVRRLIIAGSLLAVLMTWIPVAVTAVGWWVPLAFYLPMAAVALGNGMALPGSQAGAISAVPEASGTATSVVAFQQQAIGAVLIQLVGWLQDETPWPMVVTIAISSWLALAAALLVPRRSKAANRL